MPDGNVRASPAETKHEAAVAHFLEKLTEVSRETGIGITGDAELFVMTPDDFAFRYVASAEDRLELT